MIRSAILSECERYRLELGRAWYPLDNGKGWRPYIAFIGVNPSTADAEVDDASVRKMTGFAHRWSFCKFKLVNFAGYRATDVSMLSLIPRPIGPDNMSNWDHVKKVVTHPDCSLVIPCWGNANKLKPHLRSALTEFTAQMRDIARTRPDRWRCLGYTATGDPKHPLMLPYSTPLQAWPNP